MATRIKLTELERRILDRVFFSGDGFERVEDLLAAIGGNRNQFVDALESLEADGYLSVASMGGTIVVACSDPMEGVLHGLANTPVVYHGRVGHC